jgi:hypothetical protein
MRWFAVVWATVMLQCCVHCTEPPSPQPKDFVLIAFPRTGSTLLQHLLCKQPGLVVGGELVMQFHDLQTNTWATGLTNYSDTLPVHADDLYAFRRRGDGGGFLGEVRRLSMAGATAAAQKEGGGAAEQQQHTAFGFKLMWAQHVYVIVGSPCPFLPLLSFHATRMCHSQAVVLHCPCRT